MLMPLQSVKSLLNIVLVSRLAEDLDKMILMNMMTVMTAPTNNPIMSDYLFSIKPYSASLRNLNLFFYLVCLLMRK